MRRHNEGVQQERDQNQPSTTNHNIHPRDLLISLNLTHIKKKKNTRLNKIILQYQKNTSITIKQITTLHDQDQQQLN
jgi:hypothetical protein